MSMDGLGLTSMYPNSLICNFTSNLHPYSTKLPTFVQLNNFYSKKNGGKLILEEHNGNSDGDIK